MNQINNGKIICFSIADNLKYVVCHRLIMGIKNVVQCQLKLKISIEGLPLFPSSNFHLWPILMIVNGYERPLPLRLFGVVTKPDIHDFLKLLVDEFYS